MSVELLQRVVDETTQIVDNVKEDQLGNSTPCTEWTVRDIVNHITGGATMFAISAEQGKVPDEQIGQLMGGDNLAQFHQWRDWRRIARQVPIAVIARPGYERSARASPAMSWLRRSVRPAGQAKNWTRWRLPALVLLRFRPDPTSATSLRAADPAWHRQFLPSPKSQRADPSP